MGILRSSRMLRILRGGWWLGLLAVGSGCALTSKETKKPVFYPDSPAARVHYLTTISTEEDLPGNTLMRFLGGSSAGNEAIRKPYGIVVRGRKIYVADSSGGKLVIIDLARGRFDFEADENIKRPLNLAFSPAGTLFLADSESRIIHASPYGITIADPSLAPSTAGKPSAYGEKLKMKPTAVVADEQNLYVVDNQSSDIKVLDQATGELRRTLGREGERTEDVSLPNTIAIDRTGNLYLTNIGSCKVVKMDREGKVLLSFGGMGTSPGKFIRPKGIAVDDEGLMYVVDSAFQNVQVFDPQGRLLIFFGDPGEASGAGSLSVPAGITVTRENIDFFSQYADPRFVIEKLVFVTNQYGKKKISVFGIGHRTDYEAASAGPPPPPSPAKKGSMP